MVVVTPLVGVRVCGCYGGKNPQGVSGNFVSVDHKPVNLIERFWKLKDYGAVKSGEKPLSIEDKNNNQSFFFILCSEIYFKINKDRKRRLQKRE